MLRVRSGLRDGPAVAPSRSSVARRCAFGARGDVAAPRRGARSPLPRAVARPVAPICVRRRCRRPRARGWSVSRIAGDGVPIQVSIPLPLTILPVLGPVIQLRACVSRIRRRIAADRQPDPLITALEATAKRSWRQSPSMGPCRADAASIGQARSMRRGSRILLKKSSASTQMDCATAPAPCYTKPSDGGGPHRFIAIINKRRMIMRSSSIVVSSPRTSAAPGGHLASSRARRGRALRHGRRRHDRGGPDRQQMLGGQEEVRRQEGEGFARVPRQSREQGLLARSALRPEGQEQVRRRRQSRQGLLREARGQVPGGSDRVSHLRRHRRARADDRRSRRRPRDRRRSRAIRRPCSANAGRARRSASSRSSTALLKCHAKAETKGFLDPACVQKAKDKFDGGGFPAKGCFAKLEAKLSCLTTGDTAALEAKIDAAVDDIVCQLDPAGGTCPPAACPSVLEFTPNASDPASELDIGWTGFAHDRPFVSGATLSASVIGCASATPPCGVCTFTGPIANADADSGTLPTGAAPTTPRSSAPAMPPASAVAARAASSGVRPRGSASVGSLSARSATSKGRSAERPTSSPGRLPGRCPSAAGSTARS